jgi:hypothetical protein
LKRSFCNGTGECEVYRSTRQQQKWKFADLVIQSSNTWRKGTNERRNKRANERRNRTSKRTDKRTNEGTNKRMNSSEGRAPSEVKRTRNRAKIDPNRSKIASKSRQNHFRAPLGRLWEIRGSSGTLPDAPGRSRDAPGRARDGPGTLPERLRAPPGPPGEFKKSTQELARRLFRLVIADSRSKQASGVIFARFRVARETPDP